MQRIFAIVLTFVTMLTNGLFGFFGLVRPGSTVNGELDLLFRPVAAAGTVYVIDRAQLSAEEYEATVFLQGVTAQKEAAIYVTEAGLRNTFLENYQLQYNSQNVQFDSSITEFWALVEHFKEAFGGKFVTYGSTADANDPTICMAATIAGADGIPGIPASLREAALAHGLTEVRDLREVTGSFAEKQRKIFLEYKDKLANKRVLGHYSNQSVQGRDFCIAQGAFQFYTHDLGSDTLHFVEDRAFRHEVFAWADSSALMIGFWGTDDEGAFIKDISHYGKTILPARTPNGSTQFALGGPATLTQPTRAAEKSTTAEGKHTIALYLTDGDNLAWVEGSGGVCAPYNTMLGPRRASGDTFKMSFSVSPLLHTMMPMVSAYYYDNNDNYGMGLYDEYIGSVGGNSNMYTTQFPAQTLKDVAKQTAQAMERMDLHVFTPMDQLLATPLMFFGVGTQRVINEFSQYETIRGGLWQLDPPHYNGGGGTVYWSSNGKPWITVRTSLWAPDDSHDTCTPEWLESLAEEINNRSRDTHKIDGYTVIAIHPWSIYYEDVQYFVRQLDPEKVQIVSAEELVDLVAENVPHRFAVPLG
ncbi:MAG: hypothetical protein LBS96_04500 [Oscillospiraceae bacterium]|nr:hypothetical protein [Oscillospiraceae bacterium]